MSHPDLSLRAATSDDLKELIRIENAVHVAPWNQASFQSELEKPYSQTLVLTDDETDSVVAGYIVFWMMFEECQILNVAVDLPFRGTGLGKLMVRKVADLALKKGLKRVVLNARRSNTPAIHLYQKTGFAIQHVRKRFYSNGEDAYELVLDLTAESPIEF